MATIAAPRPALAPAHASLRVPSNASSDDHEQEHHTEHGHEHISLSTPRRPSADGRLLDAPPVGAPVKEVTTKESVATSTQDRPAPSSRPTSASRPPTLNGDSVVDHAAPAAAAPVAGKRPNLSTRLTRMFSSRAERSSAASTSPPASADRARAPSASGQHSEDSGSDADGHEHHADGHAATNGGAHSELERKYSQVRKEDLNTEPHTKRRFTLYEDGSHDHCLKPDKRQETLTDVFRSMFGKKGDATPQQNEEHQLSLVSGWVDQMKSEKSASDKTGGPNCSQTLVEKYGKCHEIVGRGAFGIVRISHKADTKDPKKEQLYAVKEFRRRPSESPRKYNKRLTSEFCISSALRHPNVIHTLDLLKDAKGDFCEVMEYCAGGDLYTLVLAAGKLEVLEADCFFKQLMRGVEYIHEMGVSHRDLKPENLLLTCRGALKITDFGNGECFRMAWEKEPHMVAGLCGSAPYIAPEEYTEEEFDPRAVDVWACGVIYMAMRTGRHLWRVAKRDEDDFYDRYCEGRKGEEGYGPIESLHRGRCRNVIYSVLDPNPRRRITASQVLKSEWGREIKLCKSGEEGY